MIGENEDEEVKFKEFFEESVEPAFHPVKAPFPFERIYPRLRDWFIGKQYIFALVILAIMLILVAIEMFTNIDLGFVPNGPQ